MATHDTTLRLLADLDLGVNLSQVEKDWKGLQRSIQKSFSDTIGEAMSMGFKTADFNAVAKRLTKIQDDINSSRTRALDLERKIQEKTQSNLDAQAEKALLAREKLALKGFEERSKRELRHTNRLLDRQRQAMQEAERLMARGVGERAEEFGQSIQGAFEKVKGFDVSGIFKGLGKGTQAKGAQMQMKAAEGGQMSKMLGGLGTILSSVGPVLAAIGGIAAGFAAIAKVIIDADSKAKELNRSLLDGGIAGAEMADQFGTVYENLGLVRKAATSFSFNRMWGLKAKDHIEILKAYSEAGVTFREMTAGVKSAADQMDRLHQYTQAAVAYSKLLGMSQTEVAEIIGTWMQDLGMSLGQVQQGFSAITLAARDAGFSTKRFMSMLLQATTGMSMYNVRLEEAAGLLVNLSKILGMKMGGDFLQNLAAGFKEEGTQDRIRKTMTTGVGYSLKVLQEDAARSTGEFLRKLKDTSAETQEAFARAMGISDVGAISGADLAKKLSTMSVAQQRQMLAKAEAGGDPAMVRMLSEALNKSTAFSGGRAGAQAARQFAGAGATLMLQLNELRGVLKGKRLDEIDLRDETARMAWEQITGKSGTAALQLYQTGKQFAGRQDVISEYQARARAGDRDAVDEFNERFAKEFGVVLDDSGDRFKAVFGLEGQLQVAESIGGTKMDDTLEALVMGVGDRLLEQAEKKVSEDIELARDIADNTKDMTLILEQGVESFLEKIYRAVQWIASFFGFGSKELTGEQKTARAGAQEQLLQEFEKYRKQEELQRREITRLERRAGRLDEGSPERVRIEEEIAGRKEAMQRLKAGSVGRQAAIRGLQGIRSKKDVARLTGSEEGATTSMGMISAVGKDAEVQKAVLEGIRQAGFGEDVIRAVQEAGAAAAAAARAASQGELETAERQYDLTVPQTGLAGFGRMGAGSMGAIGRLASSLRKTREDIAKRVRGAQTRAEQEKLAEITGMAISAEEATGGAEFSLFGGPSYLGRQEGRAAVGGKSAQALSGDLYIDTEKEGERQEKAEYARRHRVEKAEADERNQKIVEELKKIEESKQVRDIAALLIKSGQVSSPGAAVARAKELLLTGRSQGIDLGKTFTELTAQPGVEKETNLATALGEAGLLGEGPLATATRRVTRVSKLRPIQDGIFGMVGGKLFSQRIDPGDQFMGYAAKGRGAPGMGAGGGRVIHNHFYNDGQGIFASMKKWAAVNGGGLV